MTQLTRKTMAALSALIIGFGALAGVAYATDAQPVEQDVVLEESADGAGVTEEAQATEGAHTEGQADVADEAATPEGTLQPEEDAADEAQLSAQASEDEADDLGAWQPVNPDGTSMAGHEGDSWRFSGGRPIEVSEDTDLPEGALQAQDKFVMWTKNADGNYVSSNGKVIVGAKRRGVDVSEWNGHIDWSKAKADDVSFAILRCGGTYWGSKKQYDDSEFLYNAKECERLGIPYGVYFFSTAENVYQAWQEANFTIAQLKDRTVTLPVYYDLEWEGVGSVSNRTMLANISKVFCNAVEAAGFKPGVYASLSWWEYYLTDTCFEQWDRWVAQYYSSCQYEGSYRLWQASSTAKVAGIGGDGVDLNFDFTDGSQDTAVKGSGKNPLQGMICPDPPDTLVAPSNKGLTVSYRTHVQSYGWQGIKTNGAMAGTSGESKRIEALQIDVGGVSGGITYRTHVQKAGWLPWMSNGAVSGTSNLGYRVEALQIKLTGDAANKYDVWYRAHVQSYGWQEWVKNGATAGTSGESKRVEALEIQLLPKGQAPSGAPTVTYDAHVQTYGWMSAVTNGQVAGTSGQSKRVEALHISLSGVSGGITYRTHVQTYGWQAWKKDGDLTGTTGQSKRLEAIEIKLTGDAANTYDVWYRAHVQRIGWQSWVKNGDLAGTSGQSLRMEALQIALTPKGSGAPSL